MKALSVRAPWWWWIIYGGKDIENRDRRTHYRGPVLIHASQWWSFIAVADEHEDAMDMYGEACRRGMRPPQSAPGMTFRQMRALGGHIVGVADIVDCHEPALHGSAGASPWHMPGKYGWKLANARPVSNPVPFKGALGLFNTPLILGPGNTLIFDPDEQVPATPGVTIIENKFPAPSGPISTRPRRKA